jgi:hypothetical protein
MLGESDRRRFLTGLGATAAASIMPWPSLAANNER